MSGMQEDGTSLVERWERVWRRIEAACARAGRDASGVRVVAVAKNQSPERVREAADAGLTTIGENRVQEAMQKQPLCPGMLEWHMVGHLQRNKARQAVALFRMIHSVDSWRLLEALDGACEEAGVRMPVCLEVNVAGEGSKSGLAPGDVPGVIARCGELSRVEVCGLMTVPPYAADPEAVRPFFRRLRELRDRCEQDAGVGLPELSMGMSNDFEVAVEEGATLVRLGRILFGERTTAWRRVTSEDETWNP